MKLTEKMITDHFDARSFERGEGYQENGRVIDAIRSKDQLWGSVAGSRYEPYQVEIRFKGKRISSECTCPVGYECKHGVALALEYLRNPGSFTDLDEVLGYLKKMSREDLFSMLEELLRSKPKIVGEIEFVKDTKASREGQVNIDAIMNRIDQIISGNLDYYHISHMEDELSRICDIGKNLEKTSNWFEAAVVYLSVLEGIVKAYDYGADDSGGSLGGLADEAVDSFSLCAVELEDIEIGSILDRVISLSFEEDYGLETGDMIVAMSRNSNLNFIESRIEKRLSGLDGDPDSFSFGYNRYQMKELLSDIYSRLGMKEKAVEVLLTDLRTTREKLGAAEILTEDKRFREALEILRHAPRNRQVNHTYFEVLTEIPKNELDKYWNTSEAVEFAFRDHGPLSSSIRRDIYDKIRNIFQKADAVEEMIEIAERIIPRTETHAKMLLYEGYPEKAAQVFKGNSKISGDIGMSIGAMAWKQRKKDLAMKVTKLALAREMGFRKKIDPADRRIIGELLKRTPKKELPILVSSFKMDGPLLKFIAQTLVPIRPDISHDLLDKNFERLDGEFLVKMIKDLGNKSPEISISLGEKAFEAFSGRSHIYYGVMIDMLKAVKSSYSRVHGTNGWDQYILELKIRFETKKKLVKMMDNM